LARIGIVFLSLALFGVGVRLCGRCIWKRRLERLICYQRRSLQALTVPDLVPAHLTEVDRVSREPLGELT